MFIEAQGIRASSAKSEMLSISLFAEMIKAIASYKHLAALRR
jgi:hypothetical protein